MNWKFKESNHDKHFLYAIPSAYLGTILFAAGLATGMEYKDKLYGNKFDWSDWTWTMLGGLIGQVLQIGTLMLCLVI